MKKSLLILPVLSATLPMLAAAPSGNLYIFGVDGDKAGIELTLTERSDDDIEEGLWRWSAEQVTVSEPKGELTVGDKAGLTLGFDTANEFGFTNDLSNSQSMLYLTPGGPAVNYDLQAGDYQVMVALFEDIDGDMGGDSWMLKFTALGVSDDDENFYLIGINATDEPSAVYRFVRMNFEEDGESYYIYTLPRTFISSCPDGLTVLDSASGTTYGLSAEFSALAPELTDESPMTFMAPDGEPVKCSLSEGYYDINFSVTGAMAMLSFVKCDNQTPDNELSYYLVGVNGATTLDAKYKFTRTVEQPGEDDGEDDDEEEPTEMITYILADVKYESAADGLYVVAEDELVKYGYNTDVEAFMPNTFGGDSPFAMLCVNGPAVNCTLDAGTYTFNMVISGEGTAMLSALPVGDDAVESIGAEQSAPVYYDLNGLRVDKPIRGLYIEKRGADVRKVVVR